MKVLITYAHHRAALAATRSLGKADLNVVTADNIKMATSFFSKYSTTHFVYPPPKFKPELFIRYIKYHIKKCDIGVIMPMKEETFIIARYMKTFDKKTKIPIPNYEKIQKANNKRYLMSFAKEIGIKVPQTYAIDHLTDLEKISKRLEFPVVIKLVIGAGAIGVMYIHSEKELIKEYKKLVQRFNLSYPKYPLIQEFIPGDGYGVSMLFNHGDPRAIFTHKRIREYPITGGASTARISVRHSKMEEYATKLLKELDWHGVAMVEFKLDNRTKEPVLMEINPRFWGSLNQAICAGVDFPYLLYTMAMDGDVKKVFSYKVGIKTRWMLGDIRAFIDHIRLKEKKRDAYKDYFKFFADNLYYDDLAISDPLPTIIQSMIPIVNFIKTGKLKFEPSEVR